MAIDALVATVLLLVLGCLLYGPWQWICTDFYRQVVFEKRDAIFDLAADGRLPFKSREYRTIRSSLEASIRFAHEMTLPRVLFFYVFVFLRRKKKPEPSGLRSAVQSITDERLRGDIQKLVTQAQRAAAITMLAKSPAVVIVLIPLAVMVVLAAVFVDGCRRFLGACSASVAEVVQREAEAVEGGSIPTVAMAAGD